MATRASIILPTFGEAPFIRWAITSAQRQTVRELEICVLCDGSPPAMIEMLQSLAKEDPRIRIFSFPKGPRHGEIYRHEVITREATGEIICYLCHDDLYLPWHVESMERALQAADFANSVAVAMGTRQDEAGEMRPDVQAVTIADLEDPLFRKIIINWRANRWGFGLIYGAHTRAAYLRLPEGWTTTPPGIPTDLFMWRKFLADARVRCASLMDITALHFDRSIGRPDWSAEERDAEIAWWFRLSQQPGFRETIRSLAWRWMAKDAAILKRLDAKDPGILRPLPLWRIPLDLWSVWRSKLFDSDWYVEQYPDVRARGRSPLWHFLRWGGLEGRSPGPTFDANRYRAKHPEIPQGVNPVVHYWRRGPGEAQQKQAEARGNTNR